MSKIKLTMNFYDSIADKTFNDWFDNDSLKPVLKEFISDLGSSPHILDIGCGTGGETKRLLELGARVTGIDNSKESLRYANKNVKTAKFINMDLLELDFETLSFEGILDAAVLFHFSEKEQYNIIMRLFNILKLNGKLLSLYPEGDYEGVQEIEINDQLLKRYVRFLPISEWINTVERSGFEFEREIACNISPFRCVLFSRSANNS